MARTPLSQSCQIVSQRSPAHSRLAPEDQPSQAVYTEYLPEYFMVKRGEPTSAKEYHVGCLQFKALHPGEPLPKRLMGGGEAPPDVLNFIDPVEEFKGTTVVREPVKPRLIRKRDTDLNTGTQADTYQPFVQLLIKDMSEDARMDILLQVAESLNMEIE